MPARRAQRDRTRIWRPQLDRLDGLSFVSSTSRCDSRFPTRANRTTRRYVSAARRQARGSVVITSKPNRGVPTMTERRWHRPAALAALCATALAALSTLSHDAAAQIPATASAQQAAPISYSRAEQLLNWHTTLLVSGD